ncbi:MAG: alpha/beta hydrolase [Chloroflexi bacterium]|nr:MAG: alpha/beta hydrolase [Chloroflexota bacterium]MBL1195384.1 alpha/beta hydrolase [Chloroflexota bacterium]NOH12667.1 alpha/beta hydrolase [Chloroflexota bacterium]
MIPTNGIRLHTALAGPEDGQIAILLHGFPEFWYGWRRQIPALATAGLRVVAPDQRGYNLSDKPKAVQAYNLDQLADDVLGLIEHFGRDKVYLAGHDWGAAVAWWVALKYPERIQKLAILNVPHPAVMRRHLMSNPIQLLRSWYIFFFQIPWLPEWLLSLNIHANGVRALKASGRTDTFSDEDLEAYQEAWSQPSAWRSTINWYRAILRHAPQRLVNARVQIPTLILWGKQDLALNFKMAEDSLKFCDDARLHAFEQATHWVQHDEADQVNRMLVEFFK